MSIFFQGICGIPAFFNTIIPSIFSHFFHFITAYLKGLNEAIKHLKNPKSIELHLDFFYEICKLSKILSKCFNIILLTSIASQFFSTLNILYVIFISLKGEIDVEWDHFICAILWLFFNFYFVLTYLNRIQNIQNEFMELFTNSSKHHIKFQIIFIQENMKFTAGKLFEIDYTFMSMFFSSIVSYLIVIIQFHLQI